MEVDADAAAVQTVTCQNLTCRHERLRELECSVCIRRLRLHPLLWAAGILQEKPLSVEDGTLCPWVAYI